MVRPADETGPDGTVRVTATVWGDPAGVTLSTFVEIPEKVMVAV
jgi:hypothetical protein